MQQFTQQRCRLRGQINILHREITQRNKLIINMLRSIQQEVKEGTIQFR